jgi:hypothetical protein
MEVYQLASCLDCATVTQKRTQAHTQYKTVGRRAALDVFVNRKVTYPTQI